MAKSNPTHLKIDFRNGVYYLDGVVTEFANFDSMVKAESPVKINLKKVRRFNSIGIRNLLRLLKALDSKTIEYYECPSEFIDQVNMIPALLGHDGSPGSIQSFYLPFICDQCSHETEVLFEPKTITALLAEGQLPEHSCEKCGSTMVVLYEEFFLFLRRSEAS